MSVADALLGSNVAVALATEEHEHHAPSLALFADDVPRRLALAAHSFAEAYSALTRRGDRAPFEFRAEEALAFLERLRTTTILVGLTPSQTFDAMRRYTARGGIGPRFYDALLGEAALVHDIPAIITWNARHMAGLFPNLLVITPSQFLSRGHHAPARPFGR